MDALLLVILPKIPKLEGFSVIQPVFNWGGVDYPQGPETLTFEETIFTFEKPINYVLDQLPAGHFGPESVWLKCENQSLDNFEKLVNGGGADDDFSNLENFLTLILKDEKKWAVILLDHYDHFGHVEQADLERLHRLLRQSLAKESVERGFFVYS